VRAQLGQEGRAAEEKLQRQWQRAERASRALGTPGVSIVYAVHFD
jgi:hypothetical protein